MEKQGYARDSKYPGQAKNPDFDCIDKIGYIFKLMRLYNNGSTSQGIRLFAKLSTPICIMVRFHH